MKTRQKWLRAALCTAAVLAGCGGGELLLLAIVTPLNGAWRVNGDVTQEGIQFTSPGPEVALFASQYPVEATLLNPSNFCGLTDDGSGQLAVAGTYDNGRVVLHPVQQPASTCIDATFTSLIRLQASAGAGRPARNYLNNRVDVQLDQGVWVSEGGATRLKFSTFISVDNNSQANQVQVCDRSPGVAPAVLAGLLDGYQEATNTRPKIAALTVNGQATPRFTQVEFVDGASLSLRSAAGQALTLRRQKEAAATTCP